MSTRDLVGVALALIVGGCASASPSAMDGPNLGLEATPAQIAGWDISVGPDGVGLPPGKGTPATGATVYEQKCQVCHGAKGAGQPNDRLVGGQGTLASKAPVRTIGSYWPYARPSSTTCAARCPTRSRTRSATTRCTQSPRTCSISTGSSVRTTR